MILSKKSILEAIEGGDMAISPFNEENLKEASYSFTIAEEITLDPNEFRVVETREHVTLSAYISCLLSTRGSIAQSGIDALNSSIFCEPGSDNTLKLEVVNHSHKTITLPAYTPIAKGVFLRVA